MILTLGMTCGPDLVHHHVGVALEQRHHGREVPDGLPLLRRLHELEQPHPVAASQHVGQAARGGGQPLGQLPGLAEQVDGEAAAALQEVAAQPRVGGELHAVGLLVQADPQPEVIRVDAQLPLHLDDVGRDEQQAAGAGAGLVVLAARDVVLTEHLGGQEAQQRTDLGAGDASTDRAGECARGVVPAALGGADRRREHRPETGDVRLHPARTVHDQDALAGRGGQTRRRRHVAGGHDRELTQLVDHVPRLVASDLGSRLDQVLGGPDRELPVDEGVHRRVVLVADARVGVWFTGRGASGRLIASP